MTVSSTVNRWTGVGNGVTTAFSYTNKIFASTDLKVYLDGVLQTSGYTVSGVGEVTGGSVTFTPAPSSGVAVLIVSDIPKTQPTDLGEFDAFPSETIEASLDRQIRINQQLATKAERTLRLADNLDGNDTLDALPEAADRASGLLGFDADGQPMISGGTGGIAISAAMTPVVQAATIGAGLTQLGVSAFIQTLLNDADASTAQDTLGATSVGKAVFAAANAAAGLSALGGQPLDALLTAIAALTTSDNKALAFSGSDAPALVDFMRSAGSWTPGISSSGGAVTSGTVTAAGYYWKFGNLVIAPFQYYNGSTSGGSGSLRITGLPFTVLNDTASAANAMGFVMRTTAFNTGAAPHTLALQPLPNTTTLEILESFDNASYAASQIGAWGAGSELVGCAIYRSAS